MTAATAPKPPAIRAPVGWWFIYLQGREDGSEVKIGKTKQPPQDRRRQHENHQGHDQPMRTLAVVLGQESDEAALKRYFSAHTSRPRSPEWFNAWHPPLREYLRFLRSQTFVARDETDLARLTPVDSSAWLPATSHARRVTGQTSLLEAANPWSDLDVDAADDEGDYYTDPRVIEAFIEATGGVDTDPCSCRAANEVVRAERYIGMHENGLLAEWHGTVWLSPPFGNWGEWAAKAVTEIEAGRTLRLGVLVTASAATNKSVHPLIQLADAICVPCGRLHAWGPKASTAQEGCLVLYTGPEPADFVSAFSGLGEFVSRARGAVMTDPLPSEALFAMAPATPSLADRFGVPPFTVLDSRQGSWQERKRRWLATGIRSELGRGEEDDASPETAPAATMREAYAASNLNGETPLPEWASSSCAQRAPGTSIFDPVLCELAYRWFAPPKARIIDPFAGGSVRGIVAQHLGHQYVGVDLSEPQIDANKRNASDIGHTGPLPIWIHGDSREIGALAGFGAPYDLLITCPPYYDLEVYSDDPRDISTLSYPAFRDTYSEILASATALLADDRYAVVVIGEVRRPDGACYGLVPDTVRAMADAGLHLYNDAILVNAVGTLALRTSRSFAPGRKLGRAHQYVLVFVKGDGRRAADACGTLEANATAE